MANSVEVIRTERIWVKQNSTLKRQTHISKNLYNEANYIIRQSYFKEKRWVKISELVGYLRSSENFQKLPEVIAFMINQGAWMKKSRSRKTSEKKPLLIAKNMEGIQ